MAVTEAWRWGAPVDEAADLLPAAGWAVAWCLSDGGMDGDGLVEYRGGSTLPKKT
jgi:hypothetical protein